MIKNSYYILFWFSAVWLIIVFGVSTLIERDIKPTLPYQKALTELEIDYNKLKHDDDMWFYDGVATCVCYGNNDEICDKSQCYCAGGNHFGTPKQQAKAIKEAIINDGEHIHCPLFYPGTA